MSAQVTEAHLRLANQLVSSPPSPLVLATLIAESEAKACDQLRAEVERLKRDYDYEHKCLEAELAKAKAVLASIEEDGTEEHNAAVRLRQELATEREKVRVLHSALQNLADEQNGAPLERRREQWQEAMDEACAALAATEETK